jgi:hypothetical protein
MVICEHFWPYVWNNWSWVMHMMSTWFWHKNRVWQHLPNTLASLLKVNGYIHTPLYVGTGGLFCVSAPVWCVQVMLYEKELSNGVRVVRHMYYAAPWDTLNAGV